GVQTCALPILRFAQCANASPYPSSTGQVSAPIHRLAASQRPMFLLNSRLGLFTAASQFEKHPFSRSYGVILPSSLTRVVPLTLGFSPRLPVSVCGTGTGDLTRGFSWQCEIRNFVTLVRSPSQLEIVGRIYLSNSLTAWTHTSSGAIPYPTASSHRSNGHEVVQEYLPVGHRLRLSASA